MIDHVEPYVRLTRLIRAPRQAVYDAWLNSEVRRQWWQADSSMNCSVCDLDASVGGKYRIGMQEGNKEFVIVGTFVELSPPSRIVFTWTWEHDPSFGGNSLVSIDLHEVEVENKAATELVLVHEKLSTPLHRSEHTTGWLGCLKSLGGYFVKLAKANQG